VAVVGVDELVVVDAVGRVAFYAGDGGLAAVEGDDLSCSVVKLVFYSSILILGFRGGGGSHANVHRRLIVALERLI
jgi:hypothetical protein